MFGEEYNKEEIYEKWENDIICSPTLHFHSWQKKAH